MKRKTRKRIIMVFATVLLVVITIFIFVHTPKFGKIPSGERLERIEKSPNYKNGKFQNLNPTPQMTNEKGGFAILKEMLKAKNRKPQQAIPSVKTDLLHLPSEENVLVWFGHSSYFLQIDGKKFLVDPVFCGNASPFPFMIKAFKGTDIYTIDDLPQIDYLIITHDHWDHLDYKTVKKIKSRVGKVITGLGTGAHLERWGYNPKNIWEGDWGDSFVKDKDVEFHTTAARHFTGRGPNPNKTLWVSFVLKTPSLKIFIGGDGGYDEHFAQIGEKFGEFDLVMLENGQYNSSWKYIHMMPEEVLKAGKDLNAKRVFPVHNSKFALANHSWDEPLKAISKANKMVNQPLVTPKIGEVVFLKDTTQVFSEWWVGIN